MAIKKLVSVMAVAVALLSGCGGSSSDSSSTGSTRYVVNNTQSTNIATVAYVSDSNEELLRKSFDCPAQSKCDLWASADKPGTMLFYDKDGVLISSFIFAQKPTEIEFVKTTDGMMGLYVFDQLKNQYSIQAQTLSFRLNNFFANYESQDGLVDKYEELGIYYRIKVVKGGMKFSDFLSGLNARLLTGEVLPAGFATASNNQPWYAFLQNIFGGKTFFSLAYAQEAATNCPAGLSTAFEFGSELLGELVPIPFLGTAMEKAFDMATESCDGSNDQLANMEATLAQIQATLQGQGKALTAILNAVTDLAILDEFKQIDDSDAKLLSYVSNYMALVDGTTNKSLKDYVKSQGGFAKAYENDNFKKLVSSNVNNGLAHYWTIYKQIGSNERKEILKTALDAKCKTGAETSTNDIVDLRMNCNLIALQYNTRIAGIYANHSLILKDIVDTIAHYHKTEPAFVAGNAYMLSATESRDNQYNNIIKPHTYAVLEEIKKGFSGDGQRKGYYRTINGLDADAGYAIEQRLSDLNCVVTKWLKTDEYIEVLCPDPSNVTQKYISRVYYKKPTERDLVNFAGAIVPRDRLNKSLVRMVNSFNAPYLNIAASNPDASKYQEFSYNLTMNKPNSTSEFSQRQDFSSGLNFSGETTSSVGLLSGSALKFDYDRVENYTRTNNLLYKVTVRYVDQSDKKAYAWQILLDGQLSYIHHYLYGRMTCISHACRSQGSDGNNLDFVDGPKNVWFGKVADGKSSTDSETSIYYEINGTMMK